MARQGAAAVDERKQRWWWAGGRRMGQGGRDMGRQRGNGMRQREQRNRCRPASLRQTSCNCNIASRLTALRSVVRQAACDPRHPGAPGRGWRVAPWLPPCPVTSHGGGNTATDHHTVAGAIDSPLRRVGGRASAPCPALGLVRLISSAGLDSRYRK